MEWRRWSCHRPAHTNSAAGMHKAPASAHPSSRSPTAHAPAFSDTGRTKVRRAAVDAATACGLTTPANSTANPATAIPTTAATAFVEHRVPTVMNTALTTQSPRYERARMRSGPPKSVNRRRATAPKTANSGVCEFDVPYSATANTDGTRTAARTDRLVALRPGSRRPSHVRSPRGPDGDVGGSRWDGGESTGRTYPGGPHEGAARRPAVRQSGPRWSVEQREQSGAEVGQLLGTRHVVRVVSTRRVLHVLPRLHFDPGEVECGEPVGQWDGSR